MGFSPPAKRLKNSPNIDPRKAYISLRTESMVLVQSPDRTAWEGMSLQLERPRWSQYKLPPGTTAEPIAGNDIGALRIKGKTIQHIAAVNPAAGNWVGQSLAKPVEDEINPEVGPGWALYQAGKDFYAFSTRRNFWSVLHLEGDEEPVVATSPHDIEVVQGNRLYVFVIKQGEWSKPVEIYRRPAAPAHALAATGTDPISTATQNATSDDDDRRNLLTGEGLEPSTNGLTYLIGFHRPLELLRLASWSDTLRSSLALKVWTIPSPSQACRV
jgi:hypothetical protein